jgi:hypothetical protein
MKHLLIVLMLAANLPVTVLAGESKVNWQEPEKFSDIRPGNESRDAFQQRLMGDFETMFANFAKKLPDGHQLEVKITDLDLAGDVNAAYGMASRDIRIIKDIYSPRMNFSYTLKNQKGELLASGSESLRDMDFMSKSRLMLGSSGFPYEEKMLRDWFDRQQKKKIFPSK